MASNELTISCDDCRLDGTSACDDCVVTFLLGPREVQCQQTAVIVDVLEARAIRMLHDAGLLPDIKFERRVS